MNKWSKNAKLNALLQGIEDTLFNIDEAPVACINEMRRYMKEYPEEPDYKLAQHGRLLVYYSQVEELYKECGYVLKHRTGEELWHNYLQQVGYVVRTILHNNG